MISKWMKRLVVAAAVAPELVRAAQYNLQPPQTVIAHEIYDLHTLIFVICCVIFVVVFGAMFYSIFKHRKSSATRPAQFHENTTVEIIWTVVPFMILIAHGVAGDQDRVAMKDTSSRRPDRSRSPASNGNGATTT